MLEILQYTFMQRALLAGFMIAIICGLIGPFLVLRKLSLLGDGLAHLAFGGVALGLLLGLNPFITAFILVVFGALFVEKLIKTDIQGDAAIALILSAGVGLGVIIIGIVNGFTVDLFSYLIGSLLTITIEDIFIILGVLLFLLIVLSFMYKKLLFLTLNPQLAFLHDKRVYIVSSLFTILIAMTVVVSIRAVGILLVTALLVLPTLISLELSKSFKQTLLFSVLVSLFAVMLGIFISFYIDIPPSGAIVGLLLFLFVLVKVLNEFHKKFYLRFKENKSN